jgi:hypothetical protein
MNWLKDHAWLAGWLALPIAILNIFTQLKQSPSKEIDWTWTVIFMTFGITLGITFTPLFDAKSRSFAQTLAMLSFFAILFNRRRDN